MSKRLCSESGCDRFHYARGLCELHYCRQQRGYDPLHTRVVPVRQRLHRRTTIDAEGCWLWLGNRDKHGYGIIELDGKKLFVHRVGYEEMVGPIPAGLVIDHLCRIHNCWNPEHLEPVTDAENLRRGVGGINNAVKTHCPTGHPYDERNTYITKAGSRACKTCTAAAALRANRAAANRITTVCMDCGVQLRTVSSKRCRGCSARNRNAIRRATSAG